MLFRFSDRDGVAEPGRSFVEMGELLKSERYCRNCMDLYIPNVELKSYRFNPLPKFWPNEQAFFKNLLVTWGFQDLPENVKSLWSLRHSTFLLMELVFVWVMCVIFFFNFVFVLTSYPQRAERCSNVSPEFLFIAIRRISGGIGSVPLMLLELLA